MQSIAQFSLQGKVAVVTGAYGELGKAMCMQLAQAGATVGVLGRDQAKVAALVGSIEAADGSSFALVADVTDRPSLEAVAQQLVSLHGRCDILVNAAGGNQSGATVKPDQLFSDVDAAALTQCLDLNLVGTMLPCQVISKSCVHSFWHVDMCMHRCLASSWWTTAVPVPRARLSTLVASQPTARFLVLWRTPPVASFKCLQAKLSVALKVPIKQL